MPSRAAKKAVRVEHSRGRAEMQPCVGVATAPSGMIIFELNVPVLVDATLQSTHGGFQLRDVQLQGFVFV